MWVHDNYIHLIWKEQYFCKFQLDYGNLKKLSKKYLEKAKTSPFSLQLLTMIGHSSFDEFLCQVINFFGKKSLKLFVGQICKTCASTLDTLIAIAKTIGPQLKNLQINMISMNSGNNCCPKQIWNKISKFDLQWNFRGGHSLVVTL